MPKINIYEDDATKATGTIPSDVVFIPGFTTEDVSKLSENPKLCTNLDDFRVFGELPVLFTIDTADDGSKVVDVDKSFIMARELLAAGMPVIYYAIEYDTTNGTPAEQICSIFSDDEFVSSLEDKTEYTFKYITTGAYANYDQVNDAILASITDIAKTRGDAVALVQPKFNKDEPLTGTGSLYEYLQASNQFSGKGEYATMFAPWGNYTLARAYEIEVADDVFVKVSEAILPGCFGYLLTLANNIKTSPNYFAFAGINRGVVPNLKSLATSKKLTNRIADKYQPMTELDGKIAINAITDIKPYGLTIWGNRTLKPIAAEGLRASNFLNIRNMVSDIKKVAYRAAKELMFEQNDETLWLNFKSEVMPLLEQLKTGRGISDYRFIKLNTTYNGAQLGKGEFACAIKIYPIYPVESFEITVVLSDADVSVGE